MGLNYSMSSKNFKPEHLKVLKAILGFCAIPEVNKLEHLLKLVSLEWKLVLASKHFLKSYGAFKISTEKTYVHTLESNTCLKNISNYYLCRSLIQ